MECTYISDMAGPHFEWDPRKATQNVAKHGVTFLEAQTVFEDEEALFMPDPDHSGDEARFILLGLSAALRCGSWSSSIANVATVR